jgi:alcohol dehydrogenase, propanol-preferring
VQYAKLLSSGASVVVFARTDEKLAIAREHGADYVINTRGKSLADIKSDLLKATGQREIDAAIDCVGAEETIRTGFGLLATSGAFVSVGLVGNRIDMPLFLLVAREYARDGKPYRNTYTWYMRMREGKIVEVIAFFDTIEFTDLWTRVRPQ